jgi:hypothetical protein
MNVSDVRDQTVALLPNREALGKVKVTIAKVHAFNNAFALNDDSYDADALAAAGQTIIIG